MTKELKEYFDSIPDDYFIYYICSQYLTTIPIWERCSEKEYEKNHPKDFKEFLQSMFDGTDYRKIPVYHRGGGILDQIQSFNTEPDGYYYEKCVGYKKVLMLGSEMYEYCQTRKCMEHFFKSEN